MPPRITEIRKKILTCLLKLSQNGPVTAAELARKMEMTPQNIHLHVKALEEMGYLTVHRLTDRTATLTIAEKAEKELGLGALPIAGQIAAGFPLTPSDHTQGFMSRLSDFFDAREGDYLLKVEGTSMTGVGIFPGDMVVVRPTTEIVEGEIAVVLIKSDNLVTLKRWYIEGDQVVLVSENAAMEPMRYRKEDVTLQGQLIGRMGGKPPRKNRHS
ncbi:transcriptional repressor LexA [Deinococcus cellulosilyticus]|uniref:LexA repressor n=1 Tax=Deinococcus cellulosilyticus (strain DSM 18568 / NBRC 106333 / KACC 11606 / 5516J-15) TaxID=1223518 RepID=A0A511NAF4_DEIC1|nr:transcriptional repressor LexA [Deinococcus cellulosilyticus]GEM49790.1 lexA repressor [Deinococcus cellulosilyticus NBRC 106333 = KACC 11606]